MHQNVHDRPLQYLSASTGGAATASKEDGAGGGGFGVLYYLYGAVEESDFIFGV